MPDSLEAEISRRTRVAESVVRHVLEATFDTIAARLAAGEDVARRNFGTFVSQETPDRRGRHPRTGEPVIVGARRQVRFRPFGALRSAVNAGRTGDAEDA